MQVFSHVADTLPFYPSNDLCFGWGWSRFFNRPVDLRTTVSIHRCTEVHVNAYKYKYSFIQIFYASLEHLCVCTSILSRFIHRRAPFPAVMEHVPAAGYMDICPSIVPACVVTQHTHPVSLDGSQSLLFIQQPYLRALPHP